MIIPLGILFIIFGIIVILRPRWGNWHSWNDARHIRLYGERIYYFLIRFVSGPLLISIGILLIFHWISPHHQFFRNLNSTTATELNTKYGFEEKTRWNFFNYVSDDSKKLRYTFYYPSFISYEGATLSSNVLDDGDIVRIVVMDKSNSGNSAEITRVFHGEGYGLENLPAHLSTIYQEDISIIDQRTYQNDPLVYELITTNANIHTFYLPDSAAFVSFRVEMEIDVIGDMQRDEGLWPYDISFDM